MTNRCKFCGYRFDNDDEMICPECLTARAEDISCGVYADDNHSHSLDPFSKDFEISGTDMYKEKRNDFIAQERKEEAHDKNFRSPVYKQPYVQQQYRPPVQQQINNVPPQNRQPYNFNQNPQQNPYNQAQMNFQNTIRNMRIQNGQNPNNPQQRPQQTSSGCIVALIFFVFGLMALIMFASGYEGRNYADNVFEKSSPSNQTAVIRSAGND